MSIFICVYSGSVILSTVNFAAKHPKHQLWFFLLAGATLAFLCAAVLLMRPAKKELGLGQLLHWLAPLGIGFFLGTIVGLWSQKVAGAANPSTLQMVVSVLSFQGSTLLLVGRFVKEHQLSWDDAFGFSRNTLIAVLFGLVFACIFLPIGLGLQWLSAELLNHVAKPQEQQAVQTLRQTVSWTYRLLLGALTVLVVPAAEEMLFRGLLYPWIKKAGFPKLAFWGSSLLFALIHLNLMTFLPLFVLALILTALYEKTNNLLAPITAHTLFNAVNLVMLYISEH